MKKHLLNQVAALCLLAPAAVLSLPANAATSAEIAAGVPRAMGLEVNADSGVDPGSQLRLYLEATPGAQAIARLPGLDVGVPLRETSPGHYTGRYTVSRSDRIDAAAVIKVSLTADGRTTVSSYTFPPSFVAIAPAPVIVQPRIADNRPPRIGNLLPRQGDIVSAGPTLVAGSFDDATGAGVDPASVRIVVSGRDVTALAQVTAREFSLRDRLPPGRQTVEVTAADRAGNIAQKSWSFDVGSAVLGAPSAPLPLTVLSHSNNAFVGQEVTTIRGRTVPFANVRVEIDAISPTNRRAAAGVAQRLFTESVQADANGEFAFDFNPRYVHDNASSLPVPGTRYDLSITATRDNTSTESRLMLFQRS